MQRIAVGLAAGAGDESLAELEEFGELESVVARLSFSPDGRRLAVLHGTFDHATELEWWDLRKGEWVESVAFAPPDQSVVPALSADHALVASVEVVNRRTGAECILLRDRRRKGQVPYRLGWRGRSRVFGGELCFGPRGRWLAAWCNAPANDGFNLWDIPAVLSRPPDAWKGPVPAVAEPALAVDGGGFNGFAFCPDERVLAAAFADRVLCWDVERGRTWEVSARARKAGTPGGAAHVAFSPDGGTLAVNNFNETVSLVDAASGKLRHSLPADDLGGGAVFHPSGEIVAVPCGGAVTFWDVAAGTKRGRQPLDLDGPTVCTFSADGRRCAAADGPEIRLWDFRREEGVRGPSIERGPGPNRRSGPGGTASR